MRWIEDDSTLKPILSDRWTTQKPVQKAPLDSRSAGLFHAFNSLNRVAGANRAVWLSVLASFPPGVRPIWRIANLLAATTSHLPAVHRGHYHLRPSGHMSQQSHSRLCSFDSLFFAQTSFPPGPRPFPPFGRTGGLTASVSRESTNWGLY